jgi:chorismate lyase/3-hydroxybenzoate synthase
MHQSLPQPDPIATLHIGLSGAAAPLAPGTLARLDFGAASSHNHAAHSNTGALCLRLPLVPLPDVAVHEVWHVQAAVSSGLSDAIHWARGGGWLAAALELDEAVHGGIEAAAAAAYATLRAFQATQPERHVLRVWNYLADINAGAGDVERYKLFCAGRSRGLGDSFVGAYPAATAIGHRDPTRGLIVYWLSCAQPGTRVENPRQLSAWRYPRQYGPTAPGFARGMRLPGGALAISGTASIVGHASLHAGDFNAQLQESLANIEALLDAAGLSAGFDAHAPLKVYLRHARDLPALRAALARRLPATTPLQVMLGDVCRAELLVEIDGWRMP